VCVTDFDEGDDEALVRKTVADVKSAVVAAAKAA